MRAGDQIKENGVGDLVASWSSTPRAVLSSPRFDAIVPAKRISVAGPAAVAYTSRKPSAAVSVVRVLAQVSDPPSIAAFREACDPRHQLPRDARKDIQHRENAVIYTCDSCM